MLSEYQEFVLSKIAPARELTETEYHQLHAALGCATEILELNLSHTKENTEEELGDILFYLIFLGATIDIDPTELPIEVKFDPRQGMTIMDLTSHLESIISVMKKHVIYNKPRLEELQVLFLLCWNAFVVHVQACGTSIQLIELSNRRKLDTRYAAGFSPDESELRRDKEDE